MNKSTITGRINAKALELLEKHSDGLHWSELISEIQASDSSFHPKTINGCVWKLVQNYPDLVYKPSKGLFRLLKYKSTINENNFMPVEDSDVEKRSQSLANFECDGHKAPVSYVETMHVADGVECDVYLFPEDKSKDLGVIRVAPGKRTPLQRVLLGEKTIEQYISGKGKLTITRQDGEQEVLLADDSNHVLKIVNIGQTMQWEAASDSDLVAAEICYPPYQEGRFEDIG